MTVIMLLSKD